MDKARRAELLKLVRVGHDTEAAAAKLDISMAEVRKGGEKLRQDLDDAFATASARLRAKLLEGALDGNDLKLLSGILERREIAQQAATAENGINKIVRVILTEANCPHCGKSYRNGNDAVRGPLHSPRLRGNGSLDDASQEPDAEPPPDSKPPPARKRRSYTSGQNE